MLDSIENFIWHLFILCYQAATMAKRKFYQAGRKTLWCLRAGEVHDMVRQCVYRYTCEQPSREQCTYDRKTKTLGLEMMGGKISASHWVLPVCDAEKQAGPPRTAG